MGLLPCTCYTRLSPDRCVHECELLLGRVPIGGTVSLQPIRWDNFRATHGRKGSRKDVHDGLGVSEVFGYVDEACGELTTNFHLSIGAVVGRAYMYLVPRPPEGRCQGEAVNLWYVEYRGGRWMLDS